MVDETGRLSGIFVMGQNYKVKSKYYGGFPHGFLARVSALFPDVKSVLHLFSGKVDLETMPGDTVDINPDNNPDFVDDAQTLTRVPLHRYDLVLADPPYSNDDAERYGTTLVKRNKVMKALERCKSGTFVLWLDQVWPMFRKDQFEILGFIGIVKSTNHRFRILTIFRKL